MTKMLGVLVALVLGFVAVGTAGAQTFPNRPLRIVMGFGPGGFADITMRLLGQKLTEITGQSPDEATSLIMKAREHWFTSAPAVSE